MTALVLYLLIGLVSGFIVHRINHQDAHSGIIPTTLTAIMGSLIGGFLSEQLFGTGRSGYNLISLALSVFGSLSLALIQKSIADKAYNTQIEYPGYESDLVYYSQVTPLRSADNNPEYQKIKREEALKQAKQRQKNLVDPLKLQKFLRYIDYPASRQDIVDRAKSAGANDVVIFTLEQLPGKVFNNVREVILELQRLSGPLEI